MIKLNIYNQIDSFVDMITFMSFAYDTGQMSENEVVPICFDGTIDELLSLSDKFCKIDPQDGDIGIDRNLRKYIYNKVEWVLI